MKKIIAVCGFLVLAAMLGWKLFDRLSSDQTGGARGGARAVPVEAADVLRADLVSTVEFTGTLKPASRFVVAPKVPGRLEKLMVNIGDTVNNGDVIAVLESAEYAQQVAQAEAELQVGKAGLADAESALDVAGRDFARARELHEQKIASESELDEAEARLRAAEARRNMAEAQVRHRQAALKAAEVRLSYTKIHAFWHERDKTRVVAERFVDEGAMLRANDPIVAIVDVESLTAVINVIERDFPSINPGQSVTIAADAFPDRRFDGIIIRRAPVLQEESRQARVEIDVPNPDGLLAPGMFVRCRVRLAESGGATAVPSQALVRRDGQQGIFLVDPDSSVAGFVPVTVGIIDNGLVEVLDPALDGRVVTLGHHMLGDNTKVVVVNGEMQSGPGMENSVPRGSGGGGRQ